MPSEEHAVNDDAFGSMLSRLTPTALAADPVAAAYAAGRAAGRRGINRWRVVVVATVFVAVGGRRRPAPPDRAEPRHLSQIAVSSPVDPPPFQVLLRPSDVVLIEQAILDRGLDGLPPAPRRAVFTDRLPLF